MNNSTKTYSDGLRDAWNTAYRISMMTDKEKFDMFNVAPRDNVFECYTAEKAMRVIDIKMAMADGTLTKEILERYMQLHGIGSERLRETTSIIEVVEIIDELISRIIGR